MNIYCIDCQVFIYLAVFAKYEMMIHFFFQEPYLHTVRQAQGKRSQWRVSGQCLNSEASFLIHLLMYLATLQKQKETPGETGIVFECCG